MDQFTWGVLVSLGQALIVAVLTALVTVRLTLKQFYSQKWFEKRDEAYARILEQLAIIKYVYRSHFIETLSQSDPASWHDKKLGATEEKAREALVKLSAASQPLILPAAHEALDSFLWDRDVTYYGYTNSWVEYVDLLREGVDECFKIVAASYMQDLKGERTNSTPWQWLRSKAPLRRTPQSNAKTQAALKDQRAR